MSVSTDAAIADLVAREEIRSELYTYADRVDAGDIGAVGALFLDDGTYDILGTHCRGRDRIVARLSESLSQFERTSHHVSNPLIVLRGSAAHLSASLYAYHVRPDGTSYEFWGRYLQDLSLGGAGWAIAHMTLMGIDARPIDPGRRRTHFVGRSDRRQV